MLSGKCALVTGAGRGIGKAIALKLAEYGADICVNNYGFEEETEKTAELIRELGRKAICVQADVSDYEQVSQMMDTAVKELGKIDILVNNAGVTRDNLMLRMTEADWDFVMNINLKGSYNCTKAIMRHMMKQRSGSIVNIASVVGVTGNAGQANYSASKAGLIGLTKTTAKELSSRGIRCNAVAPGFIVSDMTDKLPDDVKAKYYDSIPLGKFGTVENVADAVAFLASDRAGYITGQVLNIDGGLVM